MTELKSEIQKYTNVTRFCLALSVLVTVFGSKQSETALLAIIATLLSASVLRIFDLVELVLGTDNNNDDVV